MIDVAFIRSANIAWSSGATTRSAAAITNQDGLLRQAGVESGALREATDVGLWVAASTVCSVSDRSWAKVFANSSRRELQESELIRLQILKERRGMVIRKIDRRLALCRCERGHVDQASDSRVVPGLGHHGSAVRMSDKQERAVDKRDRSLHSGNIVRL